MALDVKYGGSAANTPVITWPRHCESNQRWKLEKCGSEFILTSQTGSNLVLDVLDVESDKTVIVNSKNNSDSQLWELVEHESI